MDRARAVYFVLRPMLLILPFEIRLHAITPSKLRLHRGGVA